jgi:hypothetical protein
MVEAIREDDVAPFRQRRDDGEVGQVAAREIQRAIGLFETRERLLHLAEDRAMTAQEPGAGAAAPERGDCSLHPRDEYRVR